LFRGATAYPRGRGVWRDDERGETLLKEEPVIVFSYVAETDLTTNSLSELYRTLSRMGRQSSAADQGVPSFIYSPAASRFPLLFELTHPLDDLESMLLKGFAGRSLSLEALYQEHSIGKPYLMKNYQEVLRKSEREGKITAEPPAERRRKIKGEVTFSEKVMVTFPGSA
jgi:hypothetical protein